CNLYVPNGAKNKFINKLKGLLMEQEYDDLILLGDFNSVLDSTMDKSLREKVKKKDKGGNSQPAF
ncbi:hypothetical protein ABFV55_27955, partial [Pseudomonas syringae]|uniref:hypothetical protein n=1 Tax=Pseudomonas syringae TaxID=317 RepID=UPI0034D96FD0